LSDEGEPNQIQSFRCRIVTPQRTVFDGDIRELEAETPFGSIEIRPRHEPVMTPIKIGVMSVVRWERRNEKGGVERFAIHGGFLDMNGKEAVIIANAAENSDDIDLDRVQQAKARAQERLDAISRKAAESEGMDMSRAELALFRAITRIRATEKPVGSLS